MITKIRYKLFLVLALTSIASIFAMALSMHWNTQRNFNKYREQVTSARLNQMAGVLERFYLREGSWEGLLSTNEPWDLLSLTDQQEKLGRRPSRNSDRSRPPRNADGSRPPRNSDRSRPPRNTDGSRPPRSADGGRPPGEPEERRLYTSQDQQGGKRGGPPPKSSGSIFESRLILFDSDNNKIAGEPEISERKIELIVNDKRVGWIGIAKRTDSGASAIESAFLEKERYAFYIATLVVSIMSLVVALLYSRHFERPLRSLAQLARSLTEGHFSARSSVSRKDELGELSTDLNILANTLEKNEAMREQWIADTSHELRTPVTILRGEIEALRDKIRQPSDEVLESLHEEIEHLAKLIDDLNTLSQSDNSSLKFDMIEVSIDSFIEDTCSHAEALVNEKAFELKLTLNAYAKTLGDCTRLKQVFDNLIMNSLRYSSPGVISIETKIITIGQSSHIEVTLEDTPPCPSQEEIEQIFERFYRTEGSRNRKTGGRGLGLSICQRIVEAHNGSIAAYAAASGGMGIRIRLPKI